jgi:hypothetical protein
MAEAQGTKDIEQLTEHSIQPKARGEISAGFTGVLNYLAAGTYRIAPWWSPQRDADLESFWRDSNHLAGTIGMLTSKIVTIPIRVMPRDASLKAHQRQAEQLTIALNEESEFGQGLHVALSKGLQDWFGCDNGLFFEIIGDGKPGGPIKGPALGLAHLDSRRCVRTGEPDFPVTYISTNGTRHKLHRTRVAFAADMPSARDEMLGVGFCAVSRCTAIAQNLLDLSVYKMEKMGSRPKRAILIGKGIQLNAILDALKIADDQMDDRGLDVFSQIAVLADIDKDAELELLDMASLPDGFDEETSTRLAMFAIALAFGVPIRWIWPAATSGATKADAMYQHIAGLGGGIGKVLKVLSMMLGGDPRGSVHGAGKFLPPHLKLDIDFQDDEQDRMRAEIAGKRATVRKTDLEDGVIDVRTARQQALEAGDISQAQFDRMELEDGRMPSGIPLTSLFSNAKEPFLSWLDLGVPNPLMTSQNDPIDMLAEINTAAVNLQNVMANSSNVKTLGQADQALAALGQLKGMYAPLAQQAVQRDVFAKMGIGGPQAAAPEPAEEASPAEGEEAPAEGEKAFDFGVGVGEVISGELARGAGGKFVNVQQLMEQIKAGMLARLNKASAGVVENAATGKKADNRLAVAEKLGIDPALLDGLAGMKSGEASADMMQRLADMGMATVNADGSITMSKYGRALLSAGNSGDVDKATKARADASAPEEKKPEKAPKKTAEEKAAEREAERQRELADNRNSVAGGLGSSGRLDRGNFDALRSIGDGNDLPPDQARNLAQSGLVEIDAAGNARLTTEGKRVLSAADKGDLQAAKDSLSHAADKVQDALDKAETKREQADEVAKKADDLLPEAIARSDEIKESAAEIRTQAVEDAQELRERSGNLQRKSETADEKADDLSASADKLEASAAVIGDRIAAETDENRRNLLIAQQKETMEQAETKRKQAVEKREEAIQLQNQAQDALEASTRTAAEAEEKAIELEDKANKVIDDAQERADKWNKRADELRQDASGLEDSVGGATPEPRRYEETREEPGATGGVGFTQTQEEQQFGEQREGDGRERVIEPGLAGQEPEQRAATGTGDERDRAQIPEGDAEVERTVSIDVGAEDRIIEPGVSEPPEETMRISAQLEEEKGWSLAATVGSATEAVRRAIAKVRNRGQQ